jgi:hypothetical protein
MNNYKTDPDFKKQCDELHAEALKKAELFYLDPLTKLRVSTAKAHLNKGKCCEKDCRHCPYGFQTKGA